MSKSKIISAVVAVLCITGVAFAGETDLLIQKLLEKNVLDGGEAQQLIAETKDEVSKNLATAKAENVPTWAQKITWSGYTQFSFTDNPTLGGIEPFTVKRARIAMTAKLNDWATFKIQPDFSGIQINNAQTSGTATVTGSGIVGTAKSNANVLTAVPMVDVAFKEIWADLIADRDYATFRIGQYHQPFGFELPYSSSRKKVFDTPQYMTNVLAADYDYGIQLWGNLSGSAKQYLQYRLAVINGSTFGAETNPYKDYSVRLCSTVLPGLELSGSAYLRNLAGSYQNSEDLYAKYESDSFFSLIGNCPTFFTFEVAGGYDKNNLNQVLDSIVTLEVQPFGLLAPCLSGIAPVLRAEQWDPNQNDGGADVINYYTVGVNLYLDPAVRILVDYRMRDVKPELNIANVMVQLNY